MADKSLIQISSEFNQVQRMVMESGGELTPQIERLFDIIELEKKDKLDAYDYVIGQCKSQSEFFRKKADEYLKVAKTYDRIERKLLDRIKEFMLKTGQNIVEGFSIVFKLVPCRERLIIDEALLPNEYKMQVTAWVEDKEKIDNALCSGKDVPGAYKEGGFALRKSIRRPE